jgi:glucokinase
MAAAPAISRAASAAAASDPNSALRPLPPPIEVRDVARLAASGDPAARRVLAEAGRWLGQGLASLVHIFSPDRLLIGGGVAEAGDLLLEPLRAAVFEYGMPFLTQNLTLERAALTTDAGILGAAAVGLMG